MLTIKLALSNLRKGFKSFAPFLMSTITMYALLFVVASIGLSSSLAKMPGSIAVTTLMGFAVVVLTIFGTIISIYSYRFLQKQRSREFGLYDILGFGKKKIAAVAFFELLFSYFLTAVVGTLAGIAVAKFSFLVFVNMVNATSFDLAINPVSVGLVALIFLVIFVLLYFFGVAIILKSSSLDLLRQEVTGEREPKSNLIFAVLGILLIGAGYFIAIRVQDPIQALAQFFIAVLLVIFGTYLFYIASTVWYLKWRKRHNSYYQPRNFIKISSLLYRMKANAAGLANITILLSMAVVTIATTVVLYFGMADSIRTQFPMEGQAWSRKGDMTRETLVSQLEELSEKANISLPKDSIYASRYGNGMMTQVAGSSLNVTGADPDHNSSSATAVSAKITTVQDLKALKNELPDLADNQVYLYDPTDSAKNITELNIGGQPLKVKSHLKALENFAMSHVLGGDKLLIVFPSDAAYDNAVTVYNQGRVNSAVSPRVQAYFDISIAREKTFIESMSKDDTSPSDISVTFETNEINNARLQFGGFVFIGFVLGLAFILGAALIIYYKQLSEATQDKRSFKILQEVGLAKSEVKKTINSQVRMIFFLPILVTIVHSAFAYNMVSKIEAAFGIQNAELMLGLSITTIAAVVALYYLIYKWTSRVYYNIVERREGAAE